MGTIADEDEAFCAYEVVKTWKMRSLSRQKVYKEWL